MPLLRLRMHGQTSRLLLAAGVLALAAACSGCQEKIYKAGKLPLEFTASHTASTHKVDLSRLARTSAQTEVIYPGDVIQVTISTGAEEKTPESWPVRVGDNGEVNVPLVGSVRVAGLFLTDAEQTIRHESIARKVFRDPHVSVLLKDRKSISVTVVGAVKNPGTYDLPAANNDLLHSLVAAGGLTDKASTIVEIRSLPNYPGAQASYHAPRKTVAQNGEVQIDY